MTELRRPRRPWDLTPVPEREYFDLLGPGLVTVVPPRRPVAERREGDWQPPTGGAWLHVGEEGDVVAFTGKAEVGQGTRTALSLVVAEELRVPLPRVRLVMADTDLCPWDIGTFGSRSMPDAAPALGRAAAAAREQLVALAAEQPGLSNARNSLVAKEGEVRGPGRSWSYGTLVRGLRKLVEVPADFPLTLPTQWIRAGRPTLDPDAVEVVTGRRMYTSDLRRDGMLHGAVLERPRYGARLEGLADPDALADRGARIVREGEFVGAVAPDPRSARAALEALGPRWRFSPQPNERTIEEYLRQHPETGDDWDRRGRSEGDVETALRRATLRFEAVYHAAYIAHVPLETRCAIAEWDGERVTVWVGTQTPFRAREAVAKNLGIPPEMVRIIVPPTGSGFGGKHGGDVATAAARLARAAGQPVRLGFTREEEFREGYFRPYAVIDVRAGLDARGRLTAWSFHNINAGAAALGTPYRIPNQRVDNVLSQSPLPQGSYRALAATTNNFARESAMDELAYAAKQDPLDFRLAHLEDDRLRAVLGRAAELSGWAGRRRERSHGFGIAAGLEKQSRIATVAEVTVGPSRRLRVDRLVSVFDAGAVVNPDNLQSQVEGAAVMAMGGALFEAVHFRDGVVLNPRLSKYRVPRFADLPEVVVELVDWREIPPAGGGETPMIAVAPALAGAIFDATGTRLRTLPLAPGGRVVARPARPRARRR